MIDKTLKFPTDNLISNRDGLGEALVDAGKINPNIVVVCADLAESVKVHTFAQTFPQRFIEVGVAEQNAVTIASGMAAVGKIPFVASYAVFSPGRNWEQIRTTICYNDQPVKIIGSHAGLASGPDGATHQALEDIALMRVLPNMTVISPCDYFEAKKATIASINQSSPVYIRLCREKTPVITTPDTPFEISRASIFRTGSDVTICATGPIIYEALLASETLALEEISVEIINVSTIKPIDEETILNSVRKTGRVITLEDHQIIGGLGSAVTELVSGSFPVPVMRLGVNDQFGQSGKYRKLLREYEMDAQAIIDAVKIIINKS